MANPIVRVESIPKAERATPNIDNKVKLMNAVKANKKMGMMVDKCPRANP